MWIQESRGRHARLEEFGIFQTLVPNGIVPIQGDLADLPTVQKAIEAGFVHEVNPIISENNEVIGFAPVEVPMDEPEELEDEEEEA